MAQSAGEKIISSLLGIHRDTLAISLGLIDYSLRPERAVEIAELLEGAAIDLRRYAGLLRSDQDTKKHPDA
jgi:hypothetical protein